MLRIKKIKFINWLLGSFETNKAKWLNRLVSKARSVFLKGFISEIYAYHSLPLTYFKMKNFSVAMVKKCREKLEKEKTEKALT